MPALSATSVTKRFGDVVAVDGLDLAVERADLPNVVYLAAAKDERSMWEHRVSLLRSDQIDRDLLEERARLVLGRVHANDVVVIDP